MTEQEYRDGWNAAVDKAQEELVRQDQFSERTLRILDIVRIERPVLTTDGPTLTERLAELRQPVNGHRPYCLSNQPGDGPCNCDLASTHPPTREQIAEAMYDTEGHPRVEWSVLPQATRDVYLGYADAVLVLIQNGADREWPPADDGSDLTWRERNEAGRG